MPDDPDKKNSETKKNATTEDFEIKSDRMGVVSFSGPVKVKIGATDLGASLITGTSGYSGVSGASSGYSSIYGPLGRDQQTIQKIWELEKTIGELRREANDFAKEAQQAKDSGEEKAKALEQYRVKMEQALEKQRLSFLLSGVNEKAQKLLLESDDFQKKFLETKQCEAFVMSVDIRRSTELMSKARSPQQFANFMTTLCRELEIVIKENYGVFDKFTGDGVLAFFPDFYSGKDAGYYVLSVADQCHKIFKEKYREFRSSFISVLTEVGLGIGIDYGPSHLVKMAGGLTVVGAPVVYACRMSGAPAAITLLNQPGYEKISEKFSSYCFFRETEVDIKNEGKTLAYQVQLNGKEYAPSLPEWPEATISEKEAQPDK